MMSRLLHLWPLWLAAVAVIGFAARRGAATGSDADSVTVQQLDAMRQQVDGPVLIDVRTPEEFAAGRAVGAILVPLDTIQKERDRLTKVAGGKSLALICRSGHRSQRAAEILKAAGYMGKIYNVSGGTNAWQQAGLPIER